MAFILEEDGTLSRLRLEGAINISSAAELKTMLVEALSKGNELRLSLDQATELDVSILQLLWCADRQWRQCGKTFVLLGPPPDEVAAVIADAGMERLHVSSPVGVVCEV